MALLPMRGWAQTWDGYAGNAQHMALSATPSQPLMGIHWSTPVDLDPQFTGGGELLIHYGAPVITADNTVIVPVKTGATGGFELEGLNGADGSVKWTQPTDYLLPAQSSGATYSWTPSYGPALANGNTVYYAGAGGTIYSRSALDSNGAVTPTQTPFYGSLATYQANEAAYNADVSISTPITADAQGNIYFGYQTNSSAPGGLSSGIARIGADGSKAFFAANQLMVGSANAGLNQVATNCAPAVSADGTKIYVAMNSGNFTSGRLVELNSSLAPITSVALLDQKTGGSARVPNDGTASPMIGPDGDVYMGVYDVAATSRGWMDHFSANLAPAVPPKAVGGFGWDDTASVVPASMVPSYHGTSSYLLMTKYNNYVGPGGNGQNMIAILDPNATQVDTRYNSNGAGGATIMKEVLTIQSPTLDDDYTAQFPGATDEWCINTAVVDPATDSVLVNNEDGHLYRWNLATNTLTEAVSMTAGLGEAYTSTEIGPDGTVYAINNATLFAVGAIPSSWLHDADGDWSTKENWSVGLSPSGFGATANFLGAISTDRTVTLDGPQIVGTINFNSANRYTISGASTLTIDTPMGDGAINVIAGSHTIATPVVVNRNTTITVSQAADTLRMSGGISGADAIGVTKAGAGLLQLSTIRVGTLTINAGGVQLVVDGSAGGASRLNSLAINGTSSLDLTNNKLIVTSASVGSWNGSNYDGVSGLIASGRNGGAWNGGGIVTSQTAAQSPSFLTTLAVATAGEVNKTTFGGLSVSSTDVLVMYTYAGDANLDGKIDADDYFQIDSHYNKAGNSDKSYINGDFNYDGQINGDDYFLIDAAFTGQGMPFSSEVGLSAAIAVPEPASVAGLIIAAAVMTRRRRMARSY